MQGTNNGMSYDFGIMISQNTVSTLSKVVASTTALAGTIYALTSATNALDDALHKNQTTFGGYANTLKAIKFASDQIVKGQSAFDTSEILQGIRSLNRAGIDGKKNFDLMYAAAKATGTSFGSMANAVRTGDFSSLAEAGLITDRMAISLSRVGFNAQMASKRVLAIIEESNKRGMFDTTIKTFPELFNQFAEIKKQFWKSVIGDPKDPTGFMYQVKETFSDFNKWLAKNLHKIQKVGAVVGQIFKFMFNVTTDFARRIWKNVSSVIGSGDNFFANFQDKMMSFQLWLEITRVKINAFFDEYGGAIKKALAITLGLLALREVGVLFTNIGLAIQGMTLKGRLLRGLSTSLTFLKEQVSLLIKPFQLARTAAIGFYTALNAGNPFAWAAVAIAALVAIVYYWDTIRKYSQKVSDIGLLIISYFFPLVGISLTIAKYWNNIVNIATNWYNIIRNVWSIFADVVGYLSDITDARFSKWLNTIKEDFKGLYTFIEPVVSLVKQFYEWFSKLGEGAIGKVLTTIGNFFTKGADVTAMMADKVASERAGTKVTVGRKGVTLNETTTKDTKKLISKGNSVAEVSAIQGRKSEAVASDVKSTLTNQYGATMAIENGAITINIAKGDNINEELLVKRLIKELEAYNSKQSMRSGKLNTAVQ